MSTQEVVAKLLHAVLTGDKAAAERIVNEAKASKPKTNEKESKMGKPEGKNLADAGAQASVVEIKYHEGAMFLPHGMSVDDAIDFLQRRREFENEKVTFSESYNYFPLDGAVALDRVLTERFGWSAATATPSFFGPQPPELMNVEVAYNLFRKVPWGSFSLPSVEGRLKTSVTKEDGRIVFRLVATVQRKDEATINAIFEGVRQELRNNSIYRGQAVKIRFRDDEGDLLEMPEPKFLDVSSISEDMLIYSRPLQESIKVNLFTPIRRVYDCIKNNIPVKRGILLGGTYGTGKSLAAHVASRIAVDAGVTYVYVPHADELADAVEFAKQYQSPACVIFCEDIDRVLDGERTVEMDDILNIIDGIDTKHSNIITVLTTNNLDGINPAMLRFGRLDAVIQVTAPDAEACERLVRHYSGPALAANADLKEVGKELEGAIPAAIAEVVKRAKLAQVMMQSEGSSVTELTPAALLTAARSMKYQLDLLETRIKSDIPKPPTIDTAIAGMVADSINSSLNGTRKRVEEIHQRLV